MKVAVIFADGTEEIEALTPVDVLRRAGLRCDIISVSGKTPTGSHGIRIFADGVAEETDFSSFDAIVIPGGMPGAVNISENTAVVSAIKTALKQGKLVAAICASPAVVLAGNGLLQCDSATCYPADAFISLLGDKYSGKDVDISGNIVTANGPLSAVKFAFAICEKLGSEPKF